MTRQSLLHGAGFLLASGLLATPLEVEAQQPVAGADRYGGHPLGALGEVTPEKTREAAQLIRDGRTYDLSMEIVPDAPAFPPRYFNHTLIYNNVYRGAGSNDMRWSEELITGYLGTFTQIDCLGHAGIGEQFYGGRQWEQIATPTGLSELGCTDLQPVLTRGILLDVAAVRGVTRLDAGYEITVPDLEEALRRHDIDRIEPGDIVVLHTGWMSVYHADPERWIEGQPGIGAPAARWLAERRPAAVGADTWGIERWPTPDETAFLIHQILITQHGIPLLENLVTEQLVRDGVHEFAFGLNFAPVRGAGQSWGAFTAYR
jgi:kynurenine formamidase